LGNLQFPYAYDLYDPADTLGHYTTACAFLGDTNRLAFCNAGNGADGTIYVQSASELLAEGFLRTGYVRYNTLELKIYKLMQARVPNNGEIFCVVNPSIEASLLTLPNVTNIMYSDKKNLQNPDSLDWADQIKMYEFAGLKFIVMPDLPGMGTALETNYVYHKKSVGLAHLMGGEGPTVDAGYDGRQKRYWVNADFIMGSKIIQNTGIYKFYSDATALLQS